MTEPLVFTPDLKEERDYWVALLSRELVRANLPLDERRSKVAPRRRESVAVEFDEATRRALSKLTGGSPFLLNAALVAALKVCLHRYAGGGLLVVGSPAARPEEGARVANALAIVDEVNGGLSFKQLLMSVRESLSQAYARQGYPFAQLVRDLGAAPAENCCPLFDVALVLEGFHGELPELANDVTLFFDATLGGRVEFNPKLFRRETVARFAGHFARALAAALADLNAPVGALDILSADERRLLLDVWNDTRADYGAACVHEAFEARAAESPEAVAVRFGGRQLTYGELNARANGLARRLRSLGVAPEVPVGLCVERSVEMVVGLLAVLKAGGCYVPLDPAYPHERLSLMLEESRAPVLLAQGHLAQKFSGRAARVVLLDADARAFGDEGAENFSGGATPDNLVYVLYTSGSTGRPKGVAMTHRAVANLLRWQEQSGALTGAAATLQFASLSFDVSFQEVFTTLSAGGTLVLITEQVRRDPSALLRLVGEERVERLFLPFVALQQLAEVAAAENVFPASLREVVTAGEQLQVTPPVITLFRQLGACALHNHYGPTETHVVSSFVLTGAPSRWPALPPIGRPVANAKLYVLDANMRPVPQGVAGELYIGGAPLARGYLNRPELTAEKFLPDPHAGAPGQRLYKTGDRARFLADGQIEFLGRLDHQVKIRGFRVEPAEIEVVLGQHASVREAAVVVNEDVPGDKRLVAYVVPDDRQPAGAGELRRHLAARLPEYMIPSAFVTLGALPLTPSGKVDRRALPAPDHARPDTGRDYVAPRNAVEETLARIWAEVLRVERVGVEDNFFELGGDSILTIQVVARATRAGLHLIPRQLFQHQTIAALATVAGTAAAAAEAEQGEVVGEAPLTPIQRWFFSLDVPRRHFWNMAYLFVSRRALEAELLGQAVGALLRHHDALRLRFRLGEGAGGWRQAHSAADDSRVPVSVADLSAVPAGGRGAAVEEEAQRLQAGLDLSEGPLIRVGLIRMGGGEADRLLIVVHHLVVDGVSWRVLLEDLQTAYEQLRGREPVSLPAKTASFKRWAEQLSEHARSEELRSELPYWLAVRRAAEGCGPLPVDFRGGENTEESARSVVVSLTPEETRSLLTGVPAAYGAQIHEALLAALARSYEAWSGQRRLLAEVEGHGREDVGGGLDVTRTVGWFTTQYPVVLEDEGGINEAELLRRVRERLRGVPRRGIGWGLLKWMGEGAEAEELRRARTAEVSFNYLGQLDQSFSETSLLGVAADSIGLPYDPEAKRPYLIYISASVLADKLYVRFVYSENFHRRASIASWVGGFAASLRALIAGARASGSDDDSGWDFPLAGVDREELERAFAQVEFEGEYAA